ncbi:uncharacterized protein [Garra rufa]|uniref:uncharacterized protein n=1 Tax=Garra rufa TaxID=137080 RepID=UPI003CCE7286
MDSPANLEKGPINNQEPSNQSALSDYTDSDETQTDINMEEENTFRVEQKDKVNVSPNEELKGGQEQMQEEIKHDTESSEPINSINLDNQGKQTTPDSTIHDNSVSQQHCHNDGLNMQERGNSREAVTASSNITDEDNEPIDDDDGEQRDKSESEQDMKKKDDVPGNNKTKAKQFIYNKETNTSVPEDQTTERKTDRYSKYATKENHSSKIKEQDSKKQCRIL